ncbi:MAG: small basic family protein [Dehalococcoidales bacterium]|nr:small basic family protein [Dehalococcoidales bacterium]
MWLPFAALLVGIVLGLVFQLSVPEMYARYTGVAILAAMDSVLGAARAEMAGEYDNRMFVSGVITNMFLAGLLTFLGDRLGVELYYAAIVAFGVRMFNNMAAIRRYLLHRGKSRMQTESG